MNLRFYPHPRSSQSRKAIIEGPIPMRDGRVALGHPPEKILEIL